MFVLLSSCLPKGGEILSVSVYPSEFGLKKMEEEGEHVPDGLFDEEDGENEDGDNNYGIDDEKLRAYELEKLR